MPGSIVSVGERVTLRTTGREDLPLHARQNNPKVRLPMGNPVANQPSLEEFAAEDFGDYTLLVVCLDDDAAGPGPADEDHTQSIGVTAIEDHGHTRPELAYWILPEYQSEGYGKEAVSLSVGIAFQEHHHPVGTPEAGGAGEDQAQHGYRSSEEYPRQLFVRYATGRLAVVVGFSKGTPPG